MGGAEEAGEGRGVLVLAVGTGQIADVCSVDEVVVVGPVVFAGSAVESSASVASGAPCPASHAGVVAGLSEVRGGTGNRAGRPRQEVPHSVDRLAGLANRKRSTGRAGRVAGLALQVRSVLVLASVASGSAGKLNCVLQIVGSCTYSHA